MTNDEQGGPERLTEGAGSADLAGGPERGGSTAAGYRGAVADSAAGGPRGASALPADDEPVTGPIGPPITSEFGTSSFSDQPAASQPGAGADRPGGGADQPGDRGDRPSRAKKRSRSSWRELPILIVVALAIALVIKTFVVQPFYIPSSSMENTLLIGDKVLVSKLVYHFRSVQPGDIIVFNGSGSWDPATPATKSSANPLDRAYDATLRPLFHSIAGLFGTPVGQTDYIKRVIGVPGDRVACCNAQGMVTVNGVPLQESSYLYPGSAPSSIRFNIVVPPGRLWVMGDHRAVSDDSRLRQTSPGHGTIPESQVIGRAFVIVWPPSQWRILPIPSTFNQPGISKVTSSAEAKQASAEEAAATQLLGAKVKPEAPYVPLAAGFAGAVPLTWLQRRARRRLARRSRIGRGQRHR